MLLLALLFVSCSAPTYLNCPTIYYPGISNECTFTIQNMDESGVVEASNLICHYNGFDVEYIISDNFIVSFEIINNTNKSLIIDKSKSYVLYNGYSSQLFKDVRSSRSTTFNNVQDAINNVQTNESGVSMTIPPYSKWSIPLQESNLKKIQKLPSFKTIDGTYPVSVYDDQDVVEFIIPYSFDYSLSKWETCRNRFFVGSIEVSHFLSSERFISNTPNMKSKNTYVIFKKNGEPDYSEARAIEEKNQIIFKKHCRKETWAKIASLPITWWLWPFWDEPFVGCGDWTHFPPKCVVE